MRTSGDADIVAIRHRGDMQSRQLACVLGMMLFLLTACGPADPCGPGPQRPTVTPRVSRPTSTPGGATATPPRVICPVATLRPTATLAYPTRPPVGRGLGLQGGTVRGITATPQNETLLAVAAGEGWTALVYRDDASGELYVSAGDTARISVGPGSAAALAFGPSQIALLRRGASGLALRVAPRVWDLASTADLTPVPTAGADVAAGYGPEGWLYVASGGAVQRFNPFDAVWEYAAAYAGAARQMARTEHGGVLLQTSAGVYRRDATVGEWTQTWSGVVDGLAVQGERVALAWQAGNAWQVAVSQDGGATWPVVQIAAGGLPGTYGPAYPLLAGDGVLEVVGSYTEPAHGDGFARYTLPIIAQRGPSGWFPAPGGQPGDQPETLSAQVAELRPVRHLMAVSSQGQSLVVWEGVQFNGASDVFALSR